MSLPEDEMSSCSSENVSEASSRLLSNNTSSSKSNSKLSDTKPSVKKSLLRKETKAGEETTKSVKMAKSEAESAKASTILHSESRFSARESLNSFFSLLTQQNQNENPQEEHYKIKRSKITQKTEEQSVAELQKPQEGNRSLIFSDLENELEPEEPEEVVVEEEISGIRYRQQMLNELKAIPDIADLSDNSSEIISVSGKRLKKMEAKAAKKRKQITIQTDEDEDGVVIAANEYESSEHEDDDDDDEQNMDDVFNKAGGTTSTSTDLSTSLLSLIDDDDRFLPPVQSGTRVTHKDSEDLLHEVIKTMIFRTEKGPVDVDPSIKEANKQVCKQLVDDLIEAVVGKCEKYKGALRLLLDKEKLRDALSVLVLELCEERVFRDKLEKSISEHFYRKKKFVYIKQVKFFDFLNYERFQKALEQLDRQLELKKETEIRVKSCESELREELSERVYFSEQQIENFENFVRATLMRNESYERLNNLITYQLKLMSKLRDDQSDMRMELFCMQHRLADIELVSMRYIGLI